MDEMQTLTDELRDLVRRMAVVEDVLTNLIEEREKTEAPRAPVEPPRAAVPEWSAASSPSPRAASVGAASNEARARVLRESALRAKMSSVNWLGAISVICFVLAAAFIIKMAIDSGWLTPARQIGLAALLGFALIGAGLRFMKFDRAYASLLPGAGIIILYLTTAAARSYYHLIDFEVALASIALVSAFCIWLYTVIKHDVYPITAALGAYLAPFLMISEPAAAQTDFILYYHIACSISFASISIWLDSRVLSMLAAYLAIGVTFFISSMTPFDVAYIWVLLAHFAIFAFAVVIHSVQKRLPMTEREAWAYFPVLLIFYAGEYALITKLNPVMAPYVSLGFAAVLVALYFAGRAGLKKESLASVNVVSAYAAIVLFHSGYLEILDDVYKPWLLPIIVLAIAFRPRSGESFTKTQIVPVLALGAVVAIETFRIIFSLIDGKADLGLTLVSFVAPASLAVLFMQERKSRATSELLPLLFMAHVLTIVAFYNVAKPFGSLAVSGIWLAYAVVVMLAGFKLRDKVVAKSALATLGLAAAKALLYDASMAPAPVRIGCLLVTGLVLYGCGFLLKKIELWD